MSRRREFAPLHDHDDTLTPTLTTTIRKDLDTIRNGWRHVLDPIDAPTTTGSIGATIRAATEDDVELPPDARFDTPLVLAFWVRAAIDEWPAILQTLQDDGRGGVHLVTTETIDCTDVPAMAQLLHREADRLAGWVAADRDYGATFAAEVAKIARAVAKVAWPPKGDRIVIGECPDCGRRVRVKAPSWQRLPQPTTDPLAYPAWDWKPILGRPITCRCGLEGDVDAWHGRLVDFEQRQPKTAAELLEVIAAAGLPRYKSTAVVRQWARQGLIAKVDTSPKGESMFDPVQVLAALTAREKKRDQAAS